MLTTNHVPNVGKIQKNVPPNIFFILKTHVIIFVRINFLFKIKNGTAYACVPMRKYAKS